MSKLKKIILLLVTITITLQPTRVFALKESDWDIFDINGIYYFDKDAANCVTSNLSGTLSKLYDGNEIISQSDLAKISANRPFYESCCSLWFSMATSRHYSLSRNQPQALQPPKWTRSLSALFLH